MDAHDYQPYSVRASNGRRWISKMRLRHVMWSRNKLCGNTRLHHRHSSRHHRPTVGPMVCFTRFWRRRGPLQPGQEGVLARDAHQPYYVRASNGRQWCYFQTETTPCHGVERRIVWQYKTVHHRRSSRHHCSTVGLRACFTRFWRRRCPLQPVQEGVLARDAHDYQPCEVRASNGRRWCYFQNEITPCHVVEREVVWQKKTAHHCLSSHQHRPQHRQTVGPRVCLTRFWRRRGSLQPGQEGVLVRDAHD